MREISKEELAKILEQHRLWRASDGSEGARANLAGAYLADANLARADLAGADLAGANLADANLAGADLAGANLARAYLARAYLADAYLARANLAGANLADAYLAGADLAGAYLADANLAGADLAGANLADAYLARAYLADAYLARAYLARANLAGAYLARANLARAYLADAKGLPADPAPPASDDEVPLVENLNSKILSAVDGESAIGKLEMSNWHSCETTHCMAGWAVHLAGKPGYDLEKKLGPRMAGALIFRKSTGKAPHFFARNDRALADLRKRAAEEQAKSTAPEG